MITKKSLKKRSNKKKVNPKSIKKSKSNINLINQKKKYNKNSICVVSYDNRKVLPENLDKLVKLNKKYCKKYNIPYFFYNNNTNYPPYWTKVLLVLEELRRKRYKYILWLDSDALIHLNQHLFTFIKLHMKNSNLLISSDPPIWDSPFNAGVWCIKNNNKTKKLLESWLSYYNKDSWTEEKGKWKCNRCRWAGLEYEQGSFIEYILPKYKNDIQIVNYKLINNNKYNKDLECIFHFAGKFKSQIKSI